jgi:hypothetical protein
MVIGKFTGGKNLHKVLRRNLMAALSVTNSCCSVADLTILQWLELPLNLIRIFKKNYAHFSICFAHHQHIMILKKSNSNIFRFILSFPTLKHRNSLSSRNQTKHLLIPPSLINPKNLPLEVLLLNLPQNPEFTNPIDLQNRQ